MALSIAHGSKLLDLSGPMGDAAQARSNSIGDEETGSEDGEDRPRGRTGGRQTGIFKWIVLNGLRLLGVIAICWAISVQLILLSSDVKGAKAGVASSATTNNSTTEKASSLDSAIQSVAAVAVSSETSIESTSTGPPTTSYAVILSDTATAAIASSSAVAEAADESSLLLYTSTGGIITSSLPTSMITEITQINAKRIMFRRDDTMATAIATAATSSSESASSSVETSASDVSAGQEYYTDTTVPNVKGGPLFAALERLSFVTLLIVALIGQIGLPEGFLIEYLSAFSMNSTPAAVGLCQYFVGLSMERAYVKQANLVPGYILLVAGSLNLLIASYLVVMERLDKKKGRIYMFNRYQRFHGVQRILFWTPLPDILIPSTSSNPFAEERPGLMERRDSEARLDEKLSQAQQNKDVAAQTRGYPTFKSGGISGLASQIPRIGEDGRMVDPESLSRAAYVRDEEDEEEEEEEEEEERLASVAPEPRRSKHKAAGSITNTTRLPAAPPPISPLISHPSISPLVQNPAAKGVPIRLQQLMQAPSEPEQPPAPPQINLIPSTASTMATGRTGKFPHRPGTAFSTNSASSSASDDSTLVKTAVKGLPAPPLRYDGPARARPKEHLVNRPMDGSRLMPVKSVLRKPHAASHATVSAQHQRGTSSGSVLDLTGVEVRAPIVPPSPHRQTWVGAASPKQQTSREARSRSVRFEVRKESDASAMSKESGVSTSSGLSDFLPAAKSTEQTSQSGQGRFHFGAVPLRKPPPTQAPPPPPASKGPYERLDSVSSADDASDLDVKRYSVASVYMDAKEVPPTPYRDPGRIQVSPEHPVAQQRSSDSSPPQSSRSGQSTSDASAGHSPQRRSRR